MSHVSCSTITDFNIVQYHARLILFKPGNWKQRSKAEIFRSLDPTLPTADQLIYGALTKMRIVDSKRVQMEVELVYDLDHPNERFNNFYLATENLSFKNLGKDIIQSSHEFLSSF